jgi:hypothetical protein
MKFGSTAACEASPTITLGDEGLPELLPRRGDIIAAFGEKEQDAPSRLLRPFESRARLPGERAKK